MKSLRILSCLVIPILVSGSPAGPAPSRSIVQAARSQIGKTVSYDPKYQTLDYPNGDIGIEAGVCTDVVVRALRSSLGIDLQKEVHEDMKGNFSRYPKNWGLKAPDKNIDHRRVPNLETYFKRKGYQLPLSMNPADYQPGDFVTCIVPPNLAHIMIVSNRTNAMAQPMIIHNIGAGVKEEDRLFEFTITGHYRITNTDGFSRAPSRSAERPIKK